MKIRTKVLMVVLPLFIFPLLLVGITSFFSARSGITKVAKEFLSYKATELFKYCARQEDILFDTGLLDVGGYRQMAQRSAEAYANAIRLSETGYFITFDSQGNVIFPGDEERNLKDYDFFKIIIESKKGLITFFYGGTDRVGYYLYFEPWDWYILLSEQTKIFYQSSPTQSGM
ncbi:MAG: hypothetical protein AMS17_01580 [Spirochaetes bacterium DG_61]|nr:MAG: hypothetical protein AMS17_01580 [Spirochaetes bacterium DG_61]